MLKFWKDRKSQDINKIYKVETKRNLTSKKHSKQN